MSKFVENKYKPKKRSKRRGRSLFSMMFGGRRRKKLFGLF